MLELPVALDYASGPALRFSGSAASAFVVGTDPIGGQTDAQIFRLGPHGLDASFGAGGSVLLAAPLGIADDFAFVDAAVQSDGSVIVVAAGATDDYQVRLTHDGAVDPTYGNVDGNDGAVVFATTDGSGGTYAPRALVLAAGDTALTVFDHQQNTGETAEEAIVCGYAP